MSTFTEHDLKCIDQRRCATLDRVWDMSTFWTRLGGGRSGCDMHRRNSLASDGHLVVGLCLIQYFRASF